MPTAKHPARSSARPKKHAFHPACLLFPPLGEAELQALADDIKRNGLKNAIVLCKGQILDGRSRLRACEMARVEPRFVEWDGEGSPVAWVLSQNLFRRHLSSSQRAVIALDVLPLLEREAKERQRAGGRVAKKCAKLTETGKASEAAARLAHSNSRYVEAVKSIQNEAPELVEKIRGGSLSVPDATKLAKKPPRIRATVLRGLNGDTSSRSIRRLTSEAESNHRAASARRFKASAALPETIKSYHCPFQELQELAKLKAGTARLILTDIPYDKQFLPQLSDLGKLAKRLLPPSGVFVTVSGQYYLPTVLELLGWHLEWRWQGTIVWRGDASVIHPLGINSQAKPCLVYSKGPWRRHGCWSDVLYASGKEKEWHPQQLPLNCTEDLIRFLTDAGDLVIDPCAGGFTTAVACYRLGRRFIGCDIDADSVAVGRKRLAEELAIAKRAQGTGRK